jgi:hypothetical protein
MPVAFTMDRRHRAVKPGKGRKDAGRPLEGVTVVDLTSHVAGSDAAVMLADRPRRHVIEAEALDGDPPGFIGETRGKLLVITINLENSDTLGQYPAESLREAGHDGAGYPEGRGRRQIGSLRAYGAVAGRVP